MRGAGAWGARPSASTLRLSTCMDAKPLRKHHKKHHNVQHFMKWWSVKLGVKLSQHEAVP